MEYDAAHVDSVSIELGFKPRPAGWNVNRRTWGDDGIQGIGSGYQAGRSYAAKGFDPNPAAWPVAEERDDLFANGFAQGVAAGVISSRLGREVTYPSSQDVTNLHAEWRAQRHLYETPQIQHSTSTEIGLA